MRQTLHAIPSQESGEDRVILIAVQFSKDEAAAVQTSFCGKIVGSTYSSGYIVVLPAILGGGNMVQWVKHLTFGRSPLWEANDRSG